MSEASLHFAQAASQVVRLCVLLNSENLELMYFFIIFIFRFIPFIYSNSAQHTHRHQTQQLHHMLLLTFCRWLDSVLYEFVSHLYWDMSRCTPHLLQKKTAIHGLIMQYVVTHIHFLCSDIYPNIALHYLEFYFLQHHVAYVQMKKFVKHYYYQGSDDTAENI